MEFMMNWNDLCANIVYLFLHVLGLWFFFGMEEFYSYKEKTLQKRQSRETKYNTTKKNIYITIYNYKLYTIARLVPNKSIQAVQLIY